MEVLFLCQSTDCLAWIWETAAGNSRRPGANAGIWKQNSREIEDRGEFDVTSKFRKLDQIKTTMQEHGTQIKN